MLLNMLKIIDSGGLLKCVHIIELCFCPLQEDDGRYSGGSSPESTGSVETSISSHFGGMNYPSLFSSKPSSHGASQQTVFLLYP